jgi:Spy/CpxP family protein refolding chaperone
MKRFVVLGLMGLSLVAATAWSQTAPSGQGQGRGGRRGGIGDVSQAVKLTDEQKTKVDELTTKARQQMREQMGQPDQSVMDKMRELRQSMLAAAKAGDDAKVEELRKEMNEMPSMVQRRKLASSYYDDVEKILTPEQKKPFEAWRKLQDADMPASLQSDADALKTALKALELSDVQKKKVDAAFTRYEAAIKALKADDAAGKRTASQAFAADVATALKPSQKVLLNNAAMGQRQRGG